MVSWLLLDQFGRLEYAEAGCEKASGDARSLIDEGGVVGWAV
jgi:hypothetical protein